MIKFTDVKLKSIVPYTGFVVFTNPNGPMVQGPSI